MASPFKMVITVDVATGKIDKVEKVGNGTSVEIRPGVPPVTPQNPRTIGTLLAHTGSNCVTLNLPGGGSYQICS